MKRRIAASGCATAEGMNYADDAPYPEPSLFGCFATRDPKRTLDQIPYGSVPPASRPAVIDVDAGEGGVVYLPRPGCLKTALPGRLVTLEQGAFSGRALHELLGRLSFALKRLHLDLTSLNYGGLFSLQWKALFRMFGHVSDGIYARAKDVVVGLDLSNQPYTLSYERFSAANPVA